MDDIEARVAQETRSHCEAALAIYPRDELLKYIRGRFQGFAAAYATLIGPQAAFEEFSKLADTEFRMGSLGDQIQAAADWLNSETRKIDTSKRPFGLEG